MSSPGRSQDHSSPSAQGGGSSDNGLSRPGSDYPQHGEGSSSSHSSASHSGSGSDSVIDVPVYPREEGEEPGLGHLGVDSRNLQWFDKQASPEERNPMQIALLSLVFWLDATFDERGVGVPQDFLRSQSADPEAQLFRWSDEMFKDLTAILVDVCALVILVNDPSNAAPGWRLNRKKLEHYLQMIKSVLIQQKLLVASFEEALLRLQPYLQKDKAPIDDAIHSCISRLCGMYQAIFVDDVDGKSFGTEGLQNEVNQLMSM